ncbi:YbaK/prolyl-tRNA synthetase associated protein [Sulfitobacter noctilucicola]|uniref:Prolyl-tRNA editing enzyme YbaK/EbsC (Cys-tRNA(Pro) deacylase) n=1 Tax=Sulfitobacter noctilucicola TaxID=1342301 RepID=A0A7W6MB93_9RHOB|nr:YbaK/EbsC family protein [Sulfitobacter noctilucicola]KIN66422.1 YbaK/prolyl-tRNA synthetase associated protein [Sulfitobacter noctilucicola]MBB4175769.1 prolyl-tRNA editing enzyme YbaK/EbsC (Cys-tRNA(Pro) deacylase) [Sulfitobacter noctilucicola]
MSKSLKRVRAALDASGHSVNIVETALARTAQDAATALGCAVDQIAKSIVLRGEQSGEAVLFITAGGRQVDLGKATTLVAEPLGKADAALIRAQTGFAIGGVSPVGHITPCRAWFDKTLLRFEEIWAAAGTPHHVFGMKPAEMLQLSGAQLSDFTQ